MQGEGPLGGALPPRDDAPRSGARCKHGCRLWQVIPASVSGAAPFTAFVGEHGPKQADVALVQEARADGGKAARL